MKLIKTDALPVTLEPNSIYFVKSVNSTVIRIYATDNMGQEAFTSDTAGFTYEAFVQYLNEALSTNTSVATLDTQGFLNSGIKINGQDTSLLGPTGLAVWKDNVSSFVVKNFGGGGNPTFGPVLGNIQGLIFAKDSMNQVWCDFHIDHDIALGTKIYPHVHYMPISNNGGVVRWGIEYYIAKGHQQQKFQGPFTIYIEQTIPVNSLGLHMVAEASDASAILSSAIEPDSFVKTRVFRDAQHVNDTHPNNIHAWCADLHYQVIRVGTKNKGPNFFT